MGVASCGAVGYESGGGLLAELVYPPTGSRTDWHTTSEYKRLIAGDVPEGAETPCGVP